MVRGRRVQLSLEELKFKTEEFFKYCDLNEYPYTIGEYAVFLGVNRQTLLNYENENVSFIGLSEEEIEQYIGTIKKAKARIEAYAERQLYNGKNPAGIIFNLKNNFGWKDTQEVISTNTNYNANSNVLKGMSKEELLQMVEKLQLNSGKEEDQQ